MALDLFYSGYNDYVLRDFDDYKRIFIWYWALGCFARWSFQSFRIINRHMGYFNGYHYCVDYDHQYKKIPALGTWLNILFVGSFIDMFNWLLPNPTDLLGQSIIFILGVMVMSIGIGIYVSPNLGAGPRDSLMLLIIEKTGWSLKKVRTGIEVIVAIVGWILGGPVGIGTILIAIGLGQLVHYTLPASQKYLNKISGYTLPFVKKSAEKHI